jgi:hypothetical protein
MNAYIWIIASLLLVIPAWVLWSFLRVYFPARMLSRLDEKISRTWQRLVDLAAREEEAEAARPKALFDFISPSGDEGHDLKLYKDLVLNIKLQELWARTRTRVVPGRKNSSKDAELVVKIAQLTSEIESFIKNEINSNSMAQIGDWNEQKIIFFKNSGIKQRASIAAIDQLVSDIKRELQICNASFTNRREADSGKAQG